MNLGRLFVHRDHRPQRITKTIVTVLGTVAPDGKVAHASLAGIEVTVPHEIIRRIDRSLAEIVALPFLAVFPKHNIAFVLSDDNERYRAVAVEGDVESRRKLRDMTGIGGVSHRETAVFENFALPWIIR